MSFDAQSARAMSREAQVRITVEANLAEVKNSANAGYRFSYYKRPYADADINREAARQLASKGFNAEAGYVTW